MAVFNLPLIYVLWSWEKADPAYRVLKDLEPPPRPLLVPFLQRSAFSLASLGALEPWFLLLDILMFLCQEVMCCLRADLGLPHIATP